MGLTLKVVEYDPGWIRTFEELREFVLPVLNDLIITIEHVGSTSVPGIAAKPIVDMDVVVSTQEDVHTAIQRLATLGYVHEGDLGANGREAFIPPDDVVWHHLYVCTVDNVEYKRHILFRFVRPSRRRQKIQ
ncbi:GrpB family protein [Cohnella hashimotonis]|uniref:GrpB family protein n=1 Tax=Cohnella hashimotonis TaxID=2826895 RepID=UPI003313809F